MNDEKEITEQVGDVNIGKFREIIKEIHWRINFILRQSKYEETKCYLKDLDDYCDAVMDDYMIKH